MYYIIIIYFFFQYTPETEKVACGTCVLGAFFFAVPQTRRESRERGKNPRKGRAPQTTSARPRHPADRPTVVYFSPSGSCCAIRRPQRRYNNNNNRYARMHTHPRRRPCPCPVVVSHGVFYIFLLYEKRISHMSYVRTYALPMLFDIIQLYITRAARTSVRTVVLYYICILTPTAR